MLLDNVGGYVAEVRVQVEVALRTTHIGLCWRFATIVKMDSNQFNWLQPTSITDGPPHTSSASILGALPSVMHQTAAFSVSAKKQEPPQSSSASSNLGSYE